MKRETILITGSAGFAGSNLVRHVLYNYKKYNIVSVDRIDSRSSMHNIYANKSHDFYIADVGDRNTMEIILEQHRPSYVINLATTTTQNKQISNNVCGLEKLIDSLCSCECKAKLIHVSPYTIYKKKENVDEDSIVEAIDTLTASYIGAENVLIGMCKQGGIKYNIIRRDEVFGPRQRGSGIVRSLYGTINSNRSEKEIEVSLANEGTVKRNIIHIEDLCKAIMTIVSNGDDNETYNVSAGVDFTDIELLYMINDNIKKFDSSYDAKFNLGYFNDDTQGKFINLNAFKIRGLGWKPSKFRGRLEQTVGWYESNSWFLR